MSLHGNARIILSKNTSNTRRKTPPATPMRGRAPSRPPRLSPVALARAGGLSGEKCFLRARRAGWTGRHGRGVCSACSRREESLALAGSCCPIVLPAGIVFRALRPPSISTQAQHNQRIGRSCVRSHGCVFESFRRSLPQKRPSKRIAFSFRSTFIFFHTRRFREKI